MRVQWACALMELLTESTLENIPLLLSGFYSSTHSPALIAFAPAIRTAREILPHYTTLRAVRRGVQEYHENILQKNITGSYEITPESLAFSRVSKLVDTNVKRAKEILSGALPYRPVGRAMAKPD